VSRCGLKVLPPEVYSTSFRGDVKPLVPGDLVEIGSCLLQALVSHYCGKPSGITKNKNKNKNKNKKMYIHRRLALFPPGLSCFLLFGLR